MAKVFVKTGSEGPRHDPYGWSEVHFTKTDGTDVVFRSGGLGYYRLYVDGKMIVESFGDDTTATDKFKEIVGVSPWEAEELPERLERHRVKRMKPAEREMHYMCQAADEEMMSWI